MADFGSLFDSAKGEADKERAETQARLQALRDEKKARFDEGMRPILEIVDPVFQAVAAQLLSKGVKLKRNANSKLLYENGDHKIARNYQFQLGHNRPGSYYHFSVLKMGFMICQVYSYAHEHNVHESGNQVLRCKLEDLTSERVEEVARLAINEVARSK